MRPFCLISLHAFVQQVTIAASAERGPDRKRCRWRDCCCREEELQTALSVATTGIVVDPVYSGKAVHGLLHDMEAQPEEWRDARVLFIHTGGLLGMYEKTAQLQPLVEQLGRSHRLQT